MTNTVGVLDKNGTLLTGLTASEIDALFADGTIHGGMLPKIGSALDAVKNGVKSSHIIDGRVEHALLLEVLTNEGVGTMIRADDTPPRVGGLTRPRDHGATHGDETRRTPAADPADARDDAREPARREGDDRRAGGEARRVRGRALPPLREQGADVRRADRVHRDDAVLARQQDPRPRPQDGVAQAEQIVVMLLSFAEKNPGMTRVLIGDALVNEDERLQARINQLIDKLEAALRQSLRIAQAANAWHGDAQRRRRRADRLRPRPLAALRQERLQAPAAGRLGRCSASSCSD